MYDRCCRCFSGSLRAAAGLRLGEALCPPVPTTRLRDPTPREGWRSASSRHTPRPHVGRQYLSPAAAAGHLALPSARSKIAHEAWRIQHLWNCPRLSIFGVSETKHELRASFRRMRFILIHMTKIPNLKSKAFSCHLEHQDSGWPADLVAMAGMGVRGLVPRGTLFERFMTCPVEPTRNGLYQSLASTCEIL